MLGAELQFFNRRFSANANGVGGTHSRTPTAWRFNNSSDDRDQAADHTGTTCVNVPVTKP